MIHSSDARQLTENSNNPSLEEQITKAARSGKNFIVIDGLLDQAVKEELLKLNYTVTKRKIRGDYRCGPEITHETTIEW
jgi:hypothetical protein